MLDSLEAFVLVAELGSFAEAARALDVVPSTVSKKVVTLEEHYGVALLHRTTRRVSLTAEGKHVLEDAREVVRRYHSIEERLREDQQLTSGKLSIVTFPAFGQLHLSRLLPVFHRQYPDIHIHLTFTENFDSIRDFDVAIQFGVLPDSDLRARKLGENPYVLCASPEYLERAGTPQRLQDLADHACMTDLNYPPLRRWVFETPQGRVVIDPRGPLQTDDPVSRYHATRGGMGIGALPAYVIREPVRRGDLVVLFPDHPIRLGDIWALHHPYERTPRRIDAFLDFAVSELKAAVTGTGPNGAGTT